MATQTGVPNQEGDNDVLRSRTDSDGKVGWSQILYISICESLAPKLAPYWQVSGTESCSVQGQ